jgi:hypothetical protein
MSINRELEAENEVLREQNLMMNKSGVEKSARIKELEDKVKGHDLRLGDDFGDDPIELVLFLKARIKELTDAITDMVDCLTGEVLKADIKAAKSIAKQALKGEGRYENYPPPGSI